MSSTLLVESTALRQPQLEIMVGPMTGRCEGRAEVVGFGPDPPDARELAQEAMERGRTAMDAGDDANAIRWLDRACRLLPRDPTLKVLLAT
ncbi:MAG: hypothetical protein JO110_21835, partial [Acetobacteraceae bacterium]|nr:hypothetical protein [Acetobacteraceae bacterium]